MRAALLGRADARLDKDGVLTITARRFREQAKNRADARARLADWVRAGLIPQKPRRATKPSRTGQGAPGRGQEAPWTDQKRPGAAGAGLMRHGLTNLCALQSRH